VGLVDEQNVTNRMGVRINPTAQFQPASHVRRFKMLNTLDICGYIPSVCNVRQNLRVEVRTSGLNSRAKSVSEISYFIRTHGSYLQRLLSSEQF
jgi:hypothetical protein